MIFLTVGNWHKGFDRLVEAVDKLKACNVITEDVIAQIGPGKYIPAKMKVISYCSPTRFADILAESRVIITHAGIGTIGQAIGFRKPVIVVPRKPELGECSDSHQLTTAKHLEKEGKILVAYEVSDLLDKLKQADNFVPCKEQGGKKIIQAVETFIEALADQKFST